MKRKFAYLKPEMDVTDIELQNCIAASNEYSSINGGLEDKGENMGIGTSATNSATSTRAQKFSWTRD